MASQSGQPELFTLPTKSGRSDDVNRKDHQGFVCPRGPCMQCSPRRQGRLQTANPRRASCLN
jgi:hypothetical protein